jgi:hypothetical protein
MRALLALIAAVGLAATAATVSAQADTATVADSPDLPWTNPAHESELELLLSRIAAEIAGKDVTIRCEGDTDWRKLVLERGGDPNSELGYVGVDFSRRTGELRFLADFAELTGEAVCLPLKRFAAAATKPTKCVVIALKRSTVYVQKRVNGTLRKVPKVVTTKVKQPPARCYLGDRRVAREMPDAYWDSYWDYASAILTVAHEAIHLGGMVGGRFPNGVVAGDPSSEAKANCFGMQKIAWVAEQLGAAPDDAQAIATFYWDVVYPRYRGTTYSRYWSADCRPGGPMDVRPAGKTAWP